MLKEMCYLHFSNGVIFIRNGIFLMMYHKLKNCRNQGGPGKRWTPIFGRSINPTSIRGADYANHITTKIFRHSYGPVK